MTAFHTPGTKLYEGRARVVYRLASGGDIAPAPPPGGPPSLPLEGAQQGLRGASPSQERPVGGRPPATRVIVKQLRAEAGPDDLRRIRHERDMLAAIDDPSVVRLLDYREDAPGPRLILEDIGGESLAHRVAAGRLPLLEALRVTAAVARALGVVHARGLVHKDVGPNNVAVAPDGRVQLFDFDLAAALPRTAAGLPPASHLEGTLPYISPEQTGRVGLSVDERSDLYSLGAMLYELLAGRPPFRGEDTLELLHAHLALRPIPPHAVDPSVPPFVSTIALKLLEKAPRSRYQSAFGVAWDLSACVDALVARGEIAPFPIGRRDVPARLHLPDRLYGRKAEIDRLADAFDACRDRPPSLTVLTGPAGIGKSALVRTLAQHVSSVEGFFGRGALAAERSSSPYAAFLAPLRAVIQQIVASGEAEVAAVHARLRQTLDGSAAALTELAPELWLLLGGRPPEPRRGDGSPASQPGDGAPQAAPNPSAQRALSRERIRMLFLDLLRAVGGPERPIVLVLDDVQWADAASLDLLSALVGSPELRGLCLLATARDEGLAPGLPFATVLEDLRARGAPVAVLPMRPLDLPALDALLGDALATPPAGARPLADLLLRKTHGNPLAVGVFLSALYQEGLLFFDPAEGRWGWDADAIEALPVAENVAPLLAERMDTLGEVARAALGVAACLDGRIDAPLLAAAGGMTEADAGDALGEAGRLGLLVPFAGALRFAHDRVREVAYNALSPQDRRRGHRGAYRALAARLADPREDEAVFEVVRHAVAAGDELDAEERAGLAELSFIAGRRARASAALEAAHAHFFAALRWLPTGAPRPLRWLAAAPDDARATPAGPSWEAPRDAAAFAHELTFAAVECAYAAARFDDADRLFPLLLARAPDDEARARAWGMRAVGAGARSFGDAIAHVRRGCALAGVDLPEKATVAALVVELARTSRALRGRSAAELEACPRLTDPRVEAALEVLGAGLAATQLTDQNMFALLTLRGVALIAQHGNCAAAAGLYAFYAMAVGAVLRDLDRMEELGRLALALARRFPDPVHACRAWLANGAFYQHHRAHVRTSLPMLEEAQRLALAAGDNATAGVAGYFLVALSFSASQPIDDVLACCDGQIRLVAHVGGADVQEALGASRQALLAFQGKTRAPGSFEAEDFDPPARRARADRLATRKTQVGVRFLEGLVHTYFDQPAEAQERFDEIHGGVEREWACLFQLGEYFHLRALALATLVADGRLRTLDREKRLVGLRLAVRKLAAWAQRNPQGFAHKYALASAELRGLTGDADAALRRYEDAIRGAQRGGFLQDMALAQERAGRFFLQRGMTDVAIPYFAAARRAYLRWGAPAKAAHLDARFPGLAQVEPLREVASIHTHPAAHTSSAETHSSRDTTTTTGAGTLDASSIVKATLVLSGERTLERLFVRMMEIVAEGAGAQRGALLLVEGSAHPPKIELYAEVTAGRRPVLAPQPRPLDEVTTLPSGILRWSLATGERVLLADASAEGPFTQDPYVASRRSRSILVMPLKWHGEVLGALSLENDLVPGAFTERRAALLGALCAQLAISLQNARHYAELERMVDDRTRALREAQSRIVALEKDATELQMAGGFAHEMRNALAGARMLLRVALGSPSLPGGGFRAQADHRLRDLFLHAAASLPDEQRAALRADGRALDAVHRELDEVLHRVEGAVARGLSITNDVLAYAGLRREERGAAAVLLRPIVLTLARDLSVPDLPVVADIPANAAVHVKPEHLRSILENIARNACEAISAAPDSKGGCVLIGAVVGPREIVLRVEDNGPGIPADIQPRIFEPFFSTKPSSGIGLGLGVVRKLVALYDGRISVESVVGHGTCFTIVLPSAPPPRLDPGEQEIAA